MEVDTPENEYDVVVVGGGMVGASFAYALSQASSQFKLRILVVEAFDPSGQQKSGPDFDARSTALSYGSSRIYDRMGLWQALQKNIAAINEIQISDRGKFGATRLNREELGVDALGYVVENFLLGNCLNAALASSDSIHFLAPASIVSINPRGNGMSLSVQDKDTDYVVNASLVVLADGGKSSICKQLGILHKSEHYEQHALITNIAFERAHNNIAYERFTDTGPLAVLPLPAMGETNRGALVWTLTVEQAVEYRELPEEELLGLLMQRFGNRLGRIVKIGSRAIYPLSLSVAQEQIRPGLALLGNVAHTLHPVAGQGLNLALRDAEVLANKVVEARAKGQPLGGMDVLQAYLLQQQMDQRKAISFTDYATRLFSSNSSAKVWLRKFGLLSIDLVPPLRREFARQAMGLAG